MKTIRKLKLNKTFEPMKTDENDEIYPNGFFKFNITKLIAHIKSSPDNFPIEEVTLASLWESSINLEEIAVQAANLSVPIILAEISPGRLNVIDGNHRVARARKNGIKTLPAYKIPPEQHHRFLITAEAYRKYLGYWNAKFAELSPSRRTTPIQIEI